MKELKEMRFISLLSDTSQLTTNEIEKAYGEFKKRLIEELSTNDDTVVHCLLSATRAELEVLDAIHRHGQGEKCA